jgi:hypothetical protein
MIVLGADTHKRSHTIAGVGAATGELLGQRTVQVGRARSGAGGLPARVGILRAVLDRSRRARAAHPDQPYGRNAQELPPARQVRWHRRGQRRPSRAARRPNAHPAPGSFRIVAGEDMLRVWKPAGGGEKWFCGDCGSSLFGRNPSHPDPIGIRMGTFVDA